MFLKRSHFLQAMLGWSWPIATSWMTLRGFWVPCIGWGSRWGKAGSCQGILISSCKWVSRCKMCKMMNMGYILIVCSSGFANKIVGPFKSDDDVTKLQRQIAFRQYMMNLLPWLRGNDSSTSLRRFSTHLQVQFSNQSERMDLKMKYYQTIIMCCFCLYWNGKVRFYR